MQGALLLFVSDYAYGQIAGKESFQFLNLPIPARMAGTGGINVSSADHDVNYFYSNPALNGDTLAGFASANYQFFVGDISHSGFTYAAKIPRLGVVSIGLQHMGYGTITSYDDTGAELGDVNAQETALVIGKSHQIGPYRLGASMKGIFSNLAGYRSSALAVDVGGTFIHPNKLLTIGLVIKNAGVVLSDYSNTAQSKLPFDVQVGTTFKPVHMPLRFSVTAYNLVTPDAAYDDPNVDTDNSSPVKDVLNHFSFGTEVLFHKNVNALIGYNFLNHQALKLERGGAGAGITLGFLVRISKFEFVVSRAAYVAGNAVWSFTLSGNVNKMIRRL
jgi:hypothetical protein